MFIRRTQTRNRISGEPYVTYRLVHSARVGNAIKQSTVLNLGSHFDLPQAHWPALAQRIDELVHGQGSLLDATLPEEVQAFAHRFAAQIIARKPSVPSLGAAGPVRAAAVAAVPATPAANPPSGPPHPASPPSPPSPPSPANDVTRYQEVDLDSLQLVDPRSVGVEHAALSAMRQCGLEDKLSELGLNRPQIAAALGNIVARMAQPGSELATHAWLKDTSSLGELIDFDFQAMDLNRLYRASDALYKHRAALQEHLFGKACSMFGLGSPTITLYDLTNTYFEGVAAGVSKAKRGHSKECRSDCPLVTLAMALDASGFVRRVQFFAGNASEPATLKDMLTGLHAQPGATVVMDAGIAAQANLTWLREQGYHYVVVSKLRERQFDPTQATEVQSAGDVTIKLQRVPNAQDKGEVLLYCHSPAREEKDRAIDTAKASGLEAALAKLQAGLSKPTGKAGTQDVATFMQRLGRAKQRFARAAQHYEIKVATDPEGKLVTAISWAKNIVPGSAAAHPGVYCLRTTLVEQDNATLWRTYIMLTELESVFRSLKTDLGLRPVFHRTDRRVEGHLFISVLAYHFVHTLRLQLKAQGINDSWNTLRQAMATQRRVTVSLQRRDGRTVHVRKATRPKPRHQTLNTILKLDPNPGRTHHVLI